MLNTDQKLLIGLLAAIAGATFACSKSETPAPAVAVNPFSVPAGSPIIIADGGGGYQLQGAKGATGPVGVHFRFERGWNGATGSTGSFTATVANAAEWDITDPDFTEILNPTNTFAKFAIGVSGSTLTLTDSGGGCTLVTQKRVFCSGYALPASIPLQGATGPTGVTGHSPSQDTNPNVDTGVKYYLIIPHK